MLVVRWWDRREPEPKRVLARLFLAGIGTGIATVLLHWLLELWLVSSGFLPPFDALSIEDGLLRVSVTSLLLAGLTQILIFLVTWTLTAHERAFTQRVDGIVYATTVAWGAALFEHVALVLRSLHMDAGLDGTPALAFELLYATLLVGTAAGYAGFSLGTVRLSERRSTSSTVLATLLRGLGEAILIHTAFRFLLFLDQDRLAGAVVLLAALYLFSRFAVGYEGRIRTA
jgi:protease prsW family protein